jgi:hypothetical protein
MMRVVDVRLFASVVALVATTAMAQAPAPTPAPTDPAAPAATAPSATQPTAAATPSATLNPRLAPGGIAGGAKGMPINVNITFDNSWSNGWLAPGYQRQPNWGSSIDARMAWRLPNADGLLPRMTLAARMQWFVNNWLPAFSNSETYDRLFRFSDLGLNLIFGGLSGDLLNFGEWASFSFTPIVGLRLPISITSRQNNLIVAPQLAAQLSWNSPEIGPLGTLFAQYTPVLRGNIYSQVGRTQEAAVSSSLNSNPAERTGAICRAEERVNGDCILEGRQSLGFFAHSLTFGWNSPGEGTHNVSVSVGTTHNFGRGLNSKVDLASEFANTDAYTVTSNGSVSYTYTVPVDFQMFITTGVASEQPFFMVGNKFGDTSPVFYVPRLPFWDFATPANGFSSAFFDVTVGF